MAGNNIKKSNMKDKNSVSPFELTYKHFNTHFFLAHEELDILLLSESPYDEPKVMEERQMAIRVVSRLYVKYIQITNQLIKCYENLANPQKRLYLRKMCDCCIGRISELKLLLADWEISDFHYLDQTALGLRLFPQELDVKIPEYFTDGRTEVEQQRKGIVEKYLADRKREDIEKIAVTKEQKMVRLAMVYIRMIQNHERARQAREYFHKTQKQHLQEELNKKMESRKSVTFKLTRVESAAVIQRAWRKYRSRKVLDSDYELEMKFLKMIPSDGNNEDVVGIIERDRKLVIKKTEEEYFKKKEEIKQDMLLYEAPRLIEQLEETIRDYFHEYKDINGTFPDFPTEEEGGSETMLAIPPEGFPEPPEETEPESKDKSSKSDKTDKSSKKSKDEDDEPEVYTLEPSKYLPDMIYLMEAFYETWPNKTIANLDKFDVNVLNEEVVKEVDHAIRLQVDEKMREELQRLSDAMKKDSKKKKKKAKKKGKKKKKGKIEKDLTPDRTLESLVEELVQQNIIRDYPKHNLKEFVGEYNLSGSINQFLKDHENEPLPCLADIRRIVNEYCILPMGSDAIHNGGAYIKSILLAGPQGSGKTLLVHSICTEIGATLMDLSDENIEGKYPGEEGLEMLLHLVLKVGRLLQPTVIYIKDAENYFWKKKPSECPLSEPSRLKKELPKLLKKIKHADRILVCGTSNSPFDADVKGLSKSYSKIICIFKPDYDCRVRLWRKFISKSVAGTTKLEFSVLGSISDGFVASHIHDTVSQVLTRRRLNSLKNIPLRASDFIYSLASHVPVYEEEQKEYLNWLQKLPLAKKKLALYEKDEEEKDEEEEDIEEDDY